MSSPFRLFRTRVPIGPGKGSPGQRAWKQIAGIMARAGHPSERDGFERALPQFQQGMGLKPDGIVNPGGPTENALNVIAVADKKGGPKLVDAVRPAFRDLSQQGLSFTPDPRNPDALGMWRDADGRRLDPDRAGQVLRSAGSGASDLTGPQQIFTERLVGKAGRDKLMQGKAMPVAASSEDAEPMSSQGSDSIEGGEEQDVLLSAAGDENSRSPERSGSRGTSIDPLEGVDGNGEATGETQPLPQLQTDDDSSRAVPEATSVPDYLRDIHRKRTKDMSNIDALGVKRDTDGKIIHPGLSQSLMDRNEGPEFSSVLNRIRIADKLKSGDSWKLMHDIGELPKARPSDVARLRGHVRVMRGDTPSNGRLERALSDEELRARKKHFSARSSQVSSASQLGGLAALVRSIPLAGAVGAIGSLGSSLTNEKAWNADKELETRRRERKNNLR